MAGWRPDTYWAGHQLAQAPTGHLLPGNTCSPLALLPRDLQGTGGPFPLRARSSGHRLEDPTASSPPTGAGGFSQKDRTCPRWSFAVGCGPNCGVVYSDEKCVCVSMCAHTHTHTECTPTHGHFGEAFHTLVFFIQFSNTCSLRKRRHYI